MKTLKRIIAAMLLMTVLVLSLASCNGGGGNNNNPIASDGKIDSKYINEKFRLYNWTGTNGGNNQESKEVYIKDLSDWNRVAEIDIDLLNYPEVENTTIKKVKFDIVADRNTTVYFLFGYNFWGSPVAEIVNLSANNMTTVTLEVDFKWDASKHLALILARNDKKLNGQGYKTSAFTEWYQTQYKITNLALYSK